MKYFTHFLLPVAAFIISINGFAQPWMKTPMVSADEQAPDSKPTFYDIQKKFNDYWKDKTPSVNEEENREEGGYQQFKRWEWFMAPRTFPTGKFFDPEILVKE